MPGGDAVKADRAGAHRARTELELVAVAVNALTGPGSLQARATAALAAVLPGLGFSAAVLRRLDPRTGHLLSAAHAGLDAACEPLLVPARKGDHPCGLSFERGATVHIPDLAASSTGPSAWAGAGYRTYVSEPLYCGGHVCGCLSVASLVCMEPDAGQLQLLKAVARPFALALADPTGP